MIDLGLLQQAIEERKLVDFDYVDRQGNATHRGSVEAYEIKLGFFYGVCFEHQQIHSFKLANMANLFVTDQTFAPRW